MPATTKAPTKRAARPQQSTKTDRARTAQADRAIERVAKYLDAAQKDLAAIGSSVGTGTGALTKDVAKLLRDARRDVTKMSKAVRKDLERLQKDLGPTPRAASKTASPAPARTKKATTAPRTRRKSAQA